MTREIPISRIDYGTNIRTERDEDIAELAKSIEEHDVLQPLVVRPTKGNRFEVICGHRRYRALERVGGDIFVPCIIREDIEDKDILKVQLEENIQRKQMSAFELVEAFEKIKAASKTKLSNEKLAKMLNKKVGWVMNQYFAIRSVNKVYGDDGLNIAKTKKLSAGKIIADYQRKQREANALHGKGYLVYKNGNKIEIRCEEAQVANNLYERLREQCKES